MPAWTNRWIPLVNQSDIVKAVESASTLIPKLAFQSQLGRLESIDYLRVGGCLAVISLEATPNLSHRRRHAAAAAQCHCPCGRHGSRGRRRPVGPCSRTAGVPIPGPFQSKAFRLQGFSKLRCGDSLKTYLARVSASTMAVFANEQFAGPIARWGREFTFPL